MTDPRVADPLDVQDVADLLPYVNRISGPPPITTDGWTAWAMGFRDGQRTNRPRPLLGFLVVAIICSVFWFAVGRATAAPRGAQAPSPGVAPAFLGAPHTSMQAPSPAQSAPAEGRASASGGGAPPTAWTVPPACGPDPCDANWLVRTGDASTYGEGWDGWTAIPEGPGYRIRVCGPADCAELTSTDAGPSLAMQRRGRVVDLDVPTFEAVCGVPWRMGTCPVSVTILRVPHG